MVGRESGGGARAGAGGCAAGCAAAVLGVWAEGKISLWRSAAAGADYSGVSRREGRSGGDRYSERLRIAGVECEPLDVRGCGPQATGAVGGGGVGEGVVVTVWKNTGAGAVSGPDARGDEPRGAAAWLIGQGL